MPETDLGLALTMLRFVRGWNQDELASASGVRSSSISDYERGKIIPGLKILQRLLGSMGYPLWAIEQTQNFVDAVRAESLVVQESEARRMDLTGEDLQAGPNSPVAIRREVEQASADASRAVSRLTRVIDLLMASPPGLPTGFSAPPPPSR